MLSDIVDRYFLCLIIQLFFRWPIELILTTSNHGVRSKSDLVWILLKSFAGILNSLI